MSGILELELILQNFVGYVLHVIIDFLMITFFCATAYHLHGSGKWKVTHEMSPADPSHSDGHPRGSTHDTSE